MLGVKKKSVQKEQLNFRLVLVDKMSLVDVIDGNENSKQQWTWGNNKK